MNTPAGAPTPSCATRPDRRALRLGGVGYRADDFGQAGVVRTATRTAYGEGGHRLAAVLADAAAGRFFRDPMGLSRFSLRRSGKPAVSTLALRGLAVWAPRTPFAQLRTSRQLRHQSVLVDDASQSVVGADAGGR